MTWDLAADIATVAAGISAVFGAVIALLTYLKSRRRGRSREEELAKLVKDLPPGWSVEVNDTDPFVYVLTIGMIVLFIVIITAAAMTT